MEKDSKKPTESLTKSELDGKVITDESGKQYVLRKPDILEKYNFVKAMGDDASNPILMGMLLPMMFIAKIDGMVFQTPRLYSDCMAGLKRIGEDGLLAVRAAVEESAATNLQEEKDSIKK